MPLTYAGDVYGLSRPRPEPQLVFGYVGAQCWRCWLLPVVLAALALALVPPWLSAARARAVAHRHAGLGARRQCRRQSAAGAQYLDDPDHRRGRPAARRAGVHDLHEDRLGDFAVLPGAAGAGCDPGAAGAGRGAVPHRRDLARALARDAGRLAPDRRCSRWRPMPQRGVGYGARSQLAPRADARPGTCALARAGPSSPAPRKLASRWRSTVPIIRRPIRRANSGPPA